uniref:Uncharacterized protein n=1 Tax=Populus trichocarpa TaxID=3694 RepID=A0A2K1WU43_POPTR
MSKVRSVSRMVIVVCQGFLYVLEGGCPQQIWSFLLCWNCPRKRLVINELETFL